MLLWFRSSRDIGHLLLLIVFISGFYFIISLPSAFAAEHDGQDYVDLYRRTVLFLSTVWIPLKISQASLPGRDQGTSTTGSRSCC